MPERDIDRTNRRRGLAVVALVVLALTLAYFWRQSMPPPRDADAGSAPAVQGTATDIAAGPGTTRGATHDGPPGFQVVMEDTPDPERARCHADRRRQLALHLSRQATPATPEDAISAALLRVLVSWDAGTATSRSLQTARRRWPEHLDLAWINLLYCHAGVGCDRTTALRHVAALDPQNAAAWFNVMQDASLRENEVAFDQALQRAAEARFYDARLGTVFLHVRPTLARLPLPASCRSPRLEWELESELGLGRAPTAADHADIAALGLEHAIAMPAYTTLSACKTGSLHLTDRRRMNCVSLLGMIAEGDTLLEQQIGLSYLLRLMADGDSQTNALRERYRRVLWLSTNSVRYMQPLPRDYGMRMWSEGEVSLLRSLAIARGEWPPPADWLPESEEQRALILGGR